MTKNGLCRVKFTILFNSQVMIHMSGKASLARSWGVVRRRRALSLSVKEGQPFGTGSRAFQDMNSETCEVFL